MPRLTGFAKAETPFGPLAGRTAIEITDAGNDSVTVSFRCGSTPVAFTCAGDNYEQLVRAMIEKATPELREGLNERLDAVLKAVA